MGIYVKKADGWTEIGSSNVVAEGSPPAPVITNPDGGAVISFTSGGEGDAGSTLAYGANIEPEDGATVEVDQDNLEVKVLGTTPFVDYVVSVYAVNMAGAGESAKTNAFQLNYNEATGGTETIVDNYNGTTEKWMVHTFTGNGTFTVGSAPQDFRVLVVGGGGGADWLQGSPGGYGGQVIATSSQTLSATDHTVTIGGGGNGGQGNGEEGPGKDSILGPVTAQGGAGKNSAGSKGGYTSQGQVTDNIDNVSRKYSGRPTNASWGSYRGAGGYNSSGGTGPGGQSGIVIVAYQIGMSTTREIAQAQAEQEARAAGVEEGIEQGQAEGYAQAQEDLQEVIEAGRIALQTYDV